MAMPQLIFHIGYHKTGTTLLQKVVFPRLDEAGSVAYVGRRFTGYADGRVYPPQIGDLVEKFKIAPLTMQEVLQLRDGLYEHARGRDKVLVSDEGFLRPFNIELVLRNFALLEVVASIKVLATIRDEWDLILSRYKHDLRVEFKNPARRGPLKRALERIPVIARLFAAPVRQEPWALEEALVYESACTYPFCRSRRDDFPCTCSNRGLKEVAISFYEFSRIESLYRERLKGEVRFVKLIDGDGLSQGGWHELLGFLDVSPDDVAMPDEAVNKGRPAQVRVNEETEARVRAHYRNAC